MIKLKTFALTIGAALLCSQPAMSHTIGNTVDGHAMKMRVLPVTASAEVRRAPDKATVSAGVITESRKSTEASAENAAKMSAIYHALQQAGIARSDIETSRYSLNPEYDYENKRKPRIVGYTANNFVTVTTTDLSKVGAIIDALSNAGANNISRVQFALSDPDSAEAEALDKAIKKARAKAQAIANSAGVSLGELQSLTINGGRYSPYSRGQDEVIVTASRIKAAPSTPINYGENTIKTSVTMVYEMR